jgi:hypothetical protein
MDLVAIFQDFFSLVAQSRCCIRPETIKLLLYKRPKRCYDLVTNEIGNDRHSGQMKPASVEVGFLLDTVIGDRYGSASKNSARGFGLS